MDRIQTVRPIYETAQDRMNELDIIGALCRHLGRTFKKLPTGPRYPMDFGIFDRRLLTAVAEVKNRPSYKGYGTVMLGLSKVVALNTYSMMGIAGLFVTQIDGEIYWIHVVQPSWAVGWGGRSDRGDPNDKEPVCFIPLKEMTKL